MSSRPSPAQRNAKNIDKTIGVYAVAAAAAGVAALALAPPAAAEVVITNTNIPIPGCQFGDCPPVNIDFNGDGVPDLQISFIAATGIGESSLILRAYSPNAGGGIVGGPIHSRSYAACLARGAKIGGSRHFAAYDQIEVSFTSHYSPSDFGRNGNWGGNHPNRFVGVKFKIHGKIHYGWVRLTVNTHQQMGMTATITEYGYETTANKSLDAGLAGTAPSEPAADLNLLRGPSLGMLALGADGVGIWKREDSAPA